MKGLRLLEYLGADIKKKNKRYENGVLKRIQV
jgi:hypothetical protein